MKSYSRFEEDLITTKEEAFEFFQKFLEEFPVLAEHSLLSVYVYERNPVREHSIVTELNGVLFKTRWREEEYRIGDSDYTDLGNWFEAPQQCDSSEYSGIDVTAVKSL